MSAGATASGIDATLQAGGQISGTVTDASAHGPLSGIAVDAYDSGGNLIYATQTDSAGDYVIGDLATGSYRLGFGFAGTGSSASSSSYAPQYYSGAATLAGASAIAVTAGATTPNINQALSPGGQITGTVTDSASAHTAGGVTVTAYDTNGNADAVTTTASDGTYALQGLPAGDYRVEFSGSGASFFGSESAYATQYYKARSTLASADSVTVALGQTTANVDAAMAGGGELGGTVTDAATTHPIGGIQVDVYGTAGDFLATTDASGDYFLGGLPAGSYTVAFYNGAASGGYLSQDYDGPAATAGQVAVVGGQLTANIDAALQSGGQITGTVSDAQTKATVSRAEVTLYGPGGEAYDFTTTAPDGTYSFGSLTTGTYYVLFDGPAGANDAPQYYNAQPTSSTETAVAVTAGKVTSGINGALTAGGQITGTVTDATFHQPIAGATVTVSASGALYGGSIATTNASGAYSVGGLGTGTYTVSFSAAGHAQQYYDNRTTASQADSVAVTAGQTTPQINAALPSGGEISGTVTESTSHIPLQNVFVDVYTTAGVYVASSRTDVNGDYTVTGLPSGTYVEEAAPYGYVYQYDGGGSTLGGATPLSVTSGQVTSGVNFAFIPPGGIAGTVTDAATHKPVAGIEVSVLGPNGSVQQQTTTAADGSYEVDGMANGSYQVEFSAANIGANYLTQYYNDQPTATGATDVTVTAGALTTNVNAALQPGGQISGTVTDAATSSGIAGGSVQVYTTSYGYLTSVPIGAGGRYTINGLATGHYYVYASGPYQSYYVSQWYGGASPTSISVTAGSLTPNINVALVQGGAITGTVTDATSQAAIAGITVTLTATLSSYPYSETWQLTTDSQGDYALYGAPAGDYTVEFSGSGYNGLGYLTQYYKGASTSSGATLVGVLADQTSSGINAALQPAGTITGTLTDATTNAPLGSAQVNVYTASGNFVETAYADTAGTYVATGLPPGAYHLEFLTDGAQIDDYIPQYYNDESSLTNADTVTVVGSQTTSDINAALEPKGMVAGAVTDAATHAGIAGVTVLIFDANDGQISSATTAADGTYTAYGVDTGSYRAEFVAPAGSGYLSQYYNGQGTFAAATAFAVTNGQTAGAINGALVLGGKIGGTITDSASTAPLAGIEVSAQSTSGVRTATTNAQGQYVIEGLATGSYSVEFTDPSDGHFSQYYNAQSTLATANVVAVTTGKLTANINAALAPAAVISGVVSNTAGAAVVSDVLVFDATTQRQVGGAVTATNGSYHVGPLPGGTYLMEFEPEMPGYPVQYYKGQATLADANAVTATIGQTTTDISATLPLPGAISGTVTGPSGAAAGVGVNAYDAGGQLAADTDTASDGTYTLNSLAAGTYHVKFVPTGGGFLPQYYKSEPTLASANSVGVTSGATTTGIDAALQSGGEIAGTVTDSVSSAPLAGIHVQIDGSAADETTVTNTNGQYSVTGLPSGSYTVAFTDPTNDHASQYYKASATVGGAQAVAVTAGQVIAGVDAALIPLGGISGKVTVAGGSTGASGATVTVYDSSGTEVTTATTGTNGTYTVAGLAASSYAVGFSWGASTSYPSQYYNGQPSLTGANAVAVADGQTTASIDGALVPLPTSSAPPTVLESPVEGQTLVEVHGTWSPGVTTYGYQWLSCTAIGTSCAPIPGATAQTFVPGPAQFGDELEVQEQGYGPSGPGAPATSTATTPVTAVPLKAVAGDDVQTTVGTPATFDGSGSTPAGEITAYAWSFGDGTSADGAIVNHGYAAPGTYTATLTVTGPSGTSSASVRVVVAAAAAGAQITVLDAGASPIAGADVVYVGPSGARISATTNGSGVASLPGLPDGADTVYAWASGDQPAAGSVTVAGGVGRATITLNSGAVVTSNLTSTEMTLAQIEAAGINPNDPANNEVFSFSLHLAFAGNGLNFVCHINTAGQFVGSCGALGWNCSLTGCQGPLGSVAGGYTDGHPYIEWLTMGGQATVLKQFFDVTLTVTNLSPQPFDITGGSAKLAVPSGLSLAPTRAPQSLTQSVPTIAGSSSQSVQWIIRGDQPGSYNLSADYNGTLQPFGAPVSVHAGIAQPLKVWGADALGLSVQADAGSLATGYPYHVRVAITDNADVPLYNLSIALASASPYGFLYQPDEHFSDSTQELDPGQTFYSHWYILVPNGGVLGAFTPPLSSISFAGQSVSPVRESAR